MSRLSEAVGHHLYSEEEILWFLRDQGEGRSFENDMKGVLLDTAEEFRVKVNELYDFHASNKERLK